MFKLLKDLNDVHGSDEGELSFERGMTVCDIFVLENLFMISESMFASLRISENTYIGRFRPIVHYTSRLRSKVYLESRAKIAQLVSSHRVSKFRGVIHGTGAFGYLSWRRTNECLANSSNQKRHDGFLLSEMRRHHRGP